MQRKQILWAGVGLVVFAVILSSRPNCDRGCRTLAEHLAQHGMEDIAAGLFA